MYEIDRYHDFCAGHRVHGHESKCAHLHGHNYRVTFTCTAAPPVPLPVGALGRRFMGQGPTQPPKPHTGLDNIGRVIDFAVVKAQLCQWLEDNWDHRFLVWEHDPMAKALVMLDPEGVFLTTFNPTAENMAQHLVEVVAPAQLAGTGVVCSRVRIEETRKCSATYTMEGA